MIIVGSTDISVVGDVHVFPELLEFINDNINVLLGSYALFGSFLLYFKTVLVGTCEEHYVIALHSLVTGDRITGNCCIAVTDVRIA